MADDKNILDNENNTEENTTTENQNIEDTASEIKDEPQTVENQDLKIEETIKTSDEVKDIISQDTQFNYTESGAILLDNETPIQNNTQVPLERKTKIKEPMSKKKKIGIVIVALAIIVVLFSAIFFPTFFFYRGKIMVKNLEDFQKINPEKYYVLSKDISIDGDLELNTSSSIDLNGHNLTINGTLKISTTEEKTIDIGTKKGKNYISKGIINAKNIIIDAENANINFDTTTLISDNLEIKNANNITILNMTANTATISCKNIIIKEAFAAVTTNSEIIFNNCDNIDIKGIVTVPTINVNGISKILLSGTSNINNLKLDDVSNAEIYGTLKSIDGGNKVAMLNGHSCPIYENIQYLAIYKPYTQNFEINNCNKVIFIDKLNTPVDLIVQEEEGKFNAKCAPYTHEGNIKYQFYLNDAELVNDDSSKNIFDLTSKFMENQAATYTISVKGVGNYSFDTFDTFEDGTILYLDSDILSTTYRYTLQLATPSNLIINNNIQTNQIELSFSSVDFADYYKVYVDGIIVMIDGSDKIQDTKLAINDYVNTLGYHSIRVIAYSNSKELIPSKEAMTSYKTILTLNDVENAKAVYLNNNDSYTITIDFAAVENAKIYKLIIDGETIRITSNTYTFTTNTLPTTITILAEGYDCYESSINQTIIPIVPYN